MGFDARGVANEFLKRAKAEGKTLTPMQALKLTYIAHGWHLARHDRPLVDEEVQAWNFGPVVPSVYKAFKAYGSGQIEKAALQYSLKFDKFYPYAIYDPFDDEATESAESVVEFVWARHKDKSGLQLSALTHQPGTPWYTVTNGGKDIGVGKVIPNDLIRDHYRAIDS